MIIRSDRIVNILYGARVNAATILSERIANRGDGADDVEVLVQTIRDTYGGKEISYAERTTLQWAIQGISPTKNLKLFDTLKSSLSDGQAVSFAKLLGIENGGSGGVVRLG